VRPSAVVASLGAVLAGATLGGCRTPPAREPTLLDREFAAYRAEREADRVEDLTARAARSKAEGDRVEAELARANERLEALRRALDEARGEERRAAAAATAATPLAPPPAGPDAPAAPPTAPAAAPAAPAVPAAPAAPAAVSAPARAAP
jgi:hypothetical protein